MNNQVSSTSQPEFLYQTIKTDLLQKISTGAYPSGTQIPTEPELCKIYNVSRITIRRAVQELVDAGNLYRLHGRGTFVSAPHLALQRGHNVIYNLSQDPIYGKATEKEVISSRLINASESIAQHLHISTNDSVQRIERVVRVNGAPCAIDRVYASTHVLPNLLTLLTSSQSLFELIDKHYGFKTDIEDLQLTASTASPSEAHLLDYASGAPLVVLDHITHTPDNTILHYSKTLWRADCVSFNFKISKQGELIAAPTHLQSDK